MPTLPAFSKRDKPTNYNLINFFLYAFWRARKIVFIYWFLLVFIVNSFFFFFFFFFLFLLYSLCEQLWFIFLEFNNLREREREKKWGTKLVNVRKQNADMGLAYFGFGDCHGQWWTHGCFMIHVRDFKKPPPHFFFFFFLTRWDKKPPLYCKEK